MHKYTARQREVLEFIKDFAAVNGRAPLRIEIARQFDINQSSAGKHVRALRRHRLLLVDKVTREITLPASPTATPSAVWYAPLAAGVPKSVFVDGVDIDAVHYRLGAVRVAAKA